MLMVQCNVCKQVAFTQDHTDPDNTSVTCTCCQQNHKHGGEDCYRSLTITLMPGGAPVTFG